MPEPPARFDPQASVSTSGGASTRSSRPRNGRRRSRSCSRRRSQRPTSTSATRGAPSCSPSRNRPALGTAPIYRFLDEPRRRFVDDFLRRTRATEQLSHRLPVGWTEGYLTLMGPDVYTERDRRLMRELVPDLTELPRRYLPRGIGGAISTREAQTAELVALGFTNRQIADVLHVEEDTIKKHVSSAMAKLCVSRRTALAVAWATGVLMNVGGIV